MDGSHEGSDELQVILPIDEFAEDLTVRLGRANGNIYHRRPGVEGVHDGQYMVRLKKKRFIVIDYSIVPNEADLRAAAHTAHISCPPGAGKQKCATPECNKVGVPVLLYDSEPNEPASLYLRAGLCFTCQRNLNEKRRTQRKRTSDTGTTNVPPRTSVIYAIGPGQKRVKLNGGETVELESDAIILNGPPNDADVKTAKDGSSNFHDIGSELSSTIREASRNTDLLLNAISGNNTTTMDAPITDSADAAAGGSGSGADGKSEGTEGTTGDIAAAVAAGVGDVNNDATNAAVDAAKPMLNGGHHHNAETSPSSQHPPSSTNNNTSADISALYDKAFHSLSKSIYLLTQWKQSWDAAVAAAVAQETAGDPSLADAVASAAAVAAAASSNGTGPDAAASQNMVSLLLAADQRKDGKTTATTNNNNKDDTTVKQEQDTENVREFAEV